MEILLSTSNPYKAAELRAILEPLGHRIFTLGDYGLKLRVDEKGETFLQNALMKAQVVSRVVNIPVLGDDSGLVVPALNGEPGVRSARYGGQLHNDLANIRELLMRMESISDRRAYQKSAVVLMYHNGAYFSGEGSVEGVITRSRRGNYGFGYDSVFYSNELKKTFGEATAVEKLSVSHRLRAINDLIAKMRAAGVKL